jgi:hypothetical protein
MQSAHLHPDRAHRALRVLRLPIAHRQHLGTDSNPKRQTTIAATPLTSITCPITPHIATTHRRPLTTRRGPSHNWHAIQASERGGRKHVITKQKTTSNLYAVVTSPWVHPSARPVEETGPFEKVSKSERIIKSTTTTSTQISRTADKAPYPASVLARPVTSGGTASGRASAPWTALSITPTAKKAS